MARLGWGGVAAVVLCAGCPDGDEMSVTSETIGSASTTITSGATGSTTAPTTTADPTTTGVSTTGESTTAGTTASTGVDTTGGGSTGAVTATGSTGEGSTGGGSTGEGSTGGGSTGDGSSTGGGSTGGSTGGMMINCTDKPPMPAGPEVMLAPAFEEFYDAYELGAVPGIPGGARLGGCVISNEDPNVLLVAGESEAPTGKIYAIEVIRGNCDHIVGYKGTAKVVANTPYVDANLVLIKSGLMFYTEWPVNRISQLLPGQMAPAKTTDLGPLGIESSVGGLGFVPPGYVDEGEMRVLTWSGGKWYHLDRTPNGELFNLANPKLTATLPNGPGGFAYVPKGSPGFETDHVIVSEWSVNKVGVYEIDANGDPKPPTRLDFFTKFPLPWGAYFEPPTGDFLFLTRGVGTDKIYIVQGFEKPPPIPQ